MGASTATESKAASSSAPAAAPAPAKGGAYTAADVAKHNKKDDVWVIVNGEVLDVTSVSPLLHS